MIEWLLSGWPAAAILPLPGAVAPRWALDRLDTYKRSRIARLVGEEKLR